MVCKNGTFRFAPLIDCFRGNRFPAGLRLRTSSIGSSPLRSIGEKEDWSLSINFTFVKMKIPRCTLIIEVRFFVCSYLLKVLLNNAVSRLISETSQPLDLKGKQGRKENIIKFTSPLELCSGQVGLSSVSFTTEWLSGRLLAIMNEQILEQASSKSLLITHRVT